MPTTIPSTNIPNQIPSIYPSQEKIDELIDLLKKAVVFDQKTNQQNCEKPELVKWLQEVLNRFDKLQRDLEIILKPKAKKLRSPRKKVK